MILPMLGLYCVCVKCLAIGVHVLELALDGCLCSVIPYFLANIFHFDVQKDTVIIACFL